MALFPKPTSNPLDLGRFGNHVHKSVRANFSVVAVYLNVFQLPE